MKANYSYHRRHKKFRTVLKKKMPPVNFKDNEHFIKSKDSNLENDSDTSTSTKSDKELERERRKDELEKAISGRMNDYYLLATEHKYINIEKIIPLPAFIKIA